MTVEVFVMQVLTLGLGTALGIVVGALVLFPFFRRDKDY